MAKAKKTKAKKKPAPATTATKKRKAKILPRGVVASMNAAVSKLNKVSKFINNDQSTEA